MKLHNDCFKAITALVKLYDEENINEWLNYGSEDFGFQILNDQEIINDLKSNQGEDNEDTETGLYVKYPLTQKLLKPYISLFSGLKDRANQIPYSC